MMIDVAIIGGTGYTGLELIRILLNHGKTNIRIVTSRSEIDKSLSEYYPSFQGMCDLTFEEFDPDHISRKADLAFVALPHAASAESVSLLMDKGLRVIDLSADFRFKDASLYGEWYGDHPKPHLLEKSVYGLTELNREEIKSTDLVGNPGCYPTSVILPLTPLLKEGLVDVESIIVNSASGLSGAGRSLSQEMLYCEVNEDFRAYKIGSHRHTPEIEDVLGKVSGQSLKITFTPHLAPMNRGIMSTITAKIKGSPSTEKLLMVMDTFYANDPFVRVCQKETFPSVANVKGSNYCDIGARVDGRTGNVVIVSAIDNLVKGAAGQAVQNMNVMYGINEEEGLKHIPLYL